MFAIAYFCKKFHSNNKDMDIPSQEIKEYAELFAKSLLNSMNSMKSQSERDQLIPRPEASRRIKRSYTTLWRWEKEGYLVPITIGGRKMYRVADIDRLMGNF